MTRDGKALLVEADAVALNHGVQTGSASGELDDLLAPPRQELQNRGFRSDLVGKLSGSFEDSLSAVSSMLESLHGVIDKVTTPIDEIQVEFGLKLTAGASAIVTAGTEANFQFTVTWKPNAGRLERKADPSS